jgi:DMSO/TMAO reductase YedYZ molybdopterin-dependent catalytic subunit
MAGNSVVVEAELTEDNIASEPVGRRLFLGGMVLGVAGIAFGRSIQDFLQSVAESDPTGALDTLSVLPTGGRFRIYSASGTFPDIPDEEYTLGVGGLVEEAFTFSLANLKEDFEPLHMTKDFQCVTGWRVRDVQWIGVKLQDIVDRAKPRGGATHLTLYSHDGLYTESFTLEQAAREDMLIAYTMSGERVSRDHGGPVRLVAAPMYGYKSVKWISHIEVTDVLEPGYWEVRGYDIDAWVGGSNGRSDAPT